MTTNPLIQSLQNPALYSHPVKDFKVIETHISWVILTGEYAYKIKKPVDFTFLDYSTLAKRKYYCELEFKLNQLLASEIYLEVIPISGTAAQPTLTNSGDVIEYALKMREFPQDNLFNRLAAKGEMNAEHIDQLAEILAEFHANTDRQAPENIGTPAQVHQPVLQNFEQIRPLLTKSADFAVLDKLETWAQQQWDQWQEVFQQRKQKGFIRACHGDIHLGNIILLDNRPIIFDCIEFNEEFRWTDVMADVAFLLMDLQDNQQETFAHQFLNRYLELTGDYAGLQVLPYYIAYRAMVRAKVNLFQLTHSTTLSEAEQQALQATYHRFIALAEIYAESKSPCLIITHGLAGSGKTTLARSFVEKLGAIQIRSDVERKRLAGLPLTAKTGSGLYQDLYDPKVTEQTYQRLLQLAELIISAGYSVIVDAAFLQADQRALFKALAERLKVPFTIAACELTSKDREKRLALRQDNSSEISEATLEVMRAQQEKLEPLTNEELTYLFKKAH